MIFRRSARVVFRVPRKLAPRPIPDHELNRVVSDEQMRELQERTAQRAERAKLDMGAHWCCSQANSVERPL